MDRIKLSDKLEISRMVEGFWRLNSWELSDQELLNLMEECVELGIDTFDNADVYAAEEAQGRAMKLKPGFRDTIKIITKGGIMPPNQLYPENKTLQYNSSKEILLRTVDNSLKRLQTDRIDLFLIHRPDFIMDPREINEAFNELKESGKVLNFGVSNFTTSQFNMLKSYCDVELVTNQIEISSMHLDPFNDGSLDSCLENRVSPMAWSPLAGGRIFTGEDERSVRLRETLEKIRVELNAESIDQVAYAFLLKHPANIIPVIGSGKIERIKAAVKATELNFTRSHWYEIWQSSLGRRID